MTRVHSTRAICARARLGLVHDPIDKAASSPIERAEELAIVMTQAIRRAQADRPGAMVFITGPSGAGKSLVLRAWMRMESRSGRPVLGPREQCATSRRAVIDVVGPGRLPARLSALSFAGLADATLLDRPVRVLSEGQRFRVALAQLMCRVQSIVPAAGPSNSDAPAIAIDEFASPLDGTTAACIARCFSRWVARTGVVAVVASSREELRGPLQPDIDVRIDLQGRALVDIRRRNGRD